MENFTALSDKEMRKITGGSLWKDAGVLFGNVSYWLSKGLSGIAEGNHTAKIIAKKKR